MVKQRRCRRLVVNKVGASVRIPLVTDEVQLVHVGDEANYGSLQVGMLQVALKGETGVFAKRLQDMVLELSLELLRLIL